MKKSIYTFLFSLLIVLFFNHSVFSQDNLGIKFSKAKNWEEVKSEAKKANKYIFMDAYTTWCGPCKMMAKEIFPREEVGNFFNDNFINVAIQFDKTKLDNDFIKGWFEDVEQLEKDHEINSYPTYLFFNPNGELVYKILGAYLDASTFIS